VWRRRQPHWRDGVEEGRGKLDRRINISGQKRSGDGKAHRWLSLQAEERREEGREGRGGVERTQA
jgi:hypothetical protein